MFDFTPKYVSIYRNNYIWSERKKSDCFSGTFSPLLEGEFNQVYDGKNLGRYQTFYTDYENYNNVNKIEWNGYTFMFYMYDRPVFNDSEKSYYFIAFG